MSTDSYIINKLDFHKRTLEGLIEGVKKEEQIYHKHCLDVLEHKRKVTRIKNNHKNSTGMLYQLSIDLAESRINGITFSLHFSKNMLGHKRSALNNFRRKVHVLLDRVDIKSANNNEDVCGLINNITDLL